MGSALDIKRVRSVAARLGHCAVDPSVWPAILNEISCAVGAAGAALLQSDVRTSDIPVSPGAKEVIDNYFANGWHNHDVRAERGVPLLLKGEKVVIDQDILSPKELETLGFYTENLQPFGFKWFAVIGFWSGSAMWGLSIQRQTREGPFTHEDKVVLGQLSGRLTEIATLSRAVGRVAISSVGNALDLLKRPAVALDSQGHVLLTNREAEELFGNDILVRNRRLVLRDRQSASVFEKFIEQLRTASDASALPHGPVVLKRRAKPPLIASILPVDPAARNPFLGARVLLVFSDLGRVTPPSQTTISHAFGLSPAETQLAALIATGISVAEAAESLGIARETARNQLKAVFAKSGTHRQAELVALLSRL